MNDKNSSDDGEHQGAEQDLEAFMAEAAEADGMPEGSDDAATQGTAGDAGEPAPKRSGGWGPAIATGLLAIAVALGVGWWLQQMMRQALQASSGVEDQVAALSGRVDERLGEMRGRIEGLDAAVDARADAAVADYQRKVDSRFQEMSDIVSRISAEQRADDRDWVLAQIEYLLFAANERLRLEGDVGSALAAMEAADRRIRELNDPALIPVREQLVKDISALQAVPRPDHAGLALYLADLTRRIDELPLRDIELVKTPQLGGDGAPAGSGATAVLARMWDDLVDLVDVETLEIPDAVITDPDGRRLLIETLRTELVTARLAVMRRDTENLQASLELLTTLVSQYFDQQSSAVIAALEALRKMQSVELAPAIPEVSGSLNAIRAIRANA